MVIILGTLFYSGPPLSTTKLESDIYFWQRGKFVPFQKLEVEYFHCLYWIEMYHFVHMFLIKRDIFMFLCCRLLVLQIGSFSVSTMTSSWLLQMRLILDLTPTKKPKDIGKKESPLLDCKRRTAYYELRTRAVTTLSVVQSSSWIVQILLMTRKLFSRRATGRGQVRGLFPCYSGMHQDAN